MWTFILHNLSTVHVDMKLVMTETEASSLYLYPEESRTRRVCHFRQTDVIYKERKLYEE